MSLRLRRLPKRQRDFRSSGQFDFAENLFGISRPVHRSLKGVVGTYVCDSSRRIEKETEAGPGNRLSSQLVKRLG